MGKIIAFANQKGGVGKTTTAINLAAALSERGKRVLLCDFDPQGNATSGFGVDPRSLETSVYDLIVSEDPDTKSGIVQTKWVDIIGANVNLAGAELDLIAMDHREARLKLVLDKVKDEYDYVFIACPPSLGLLTLNGDRISTALGLNPNKASNIQKALYGADYKTESYYDSTGNYYDPTTGQWTGNYFHNAGGNDNFPGGRTRVGENGPETVYLPQGTVIANAQETRADGGYDAPVNVYIEARTIQEFNDIIEIVRDAQRVRRMKGAPR